MTTILSRFGRFSSIAVFALLFGFAFNLFASTDASAVPGSWKDSNTITVGVQDFIGPVRDTLNTPMGGTTEYQIFEASSGAIVYFGSNVDLTTASIARYNDTRNTIGSEEVQLSNTQADVPQGTGGIGGAVPGDEETCNLSNIGWIVCPVATAIAAITDGVYALVEQLLFIDFIDDPLDTNNTLYKVWVNVRDFANITFVVAFFAVVFSQATSVGISAYGIRKMLPRIVAAAILINLSYYITIFAIDISNIIGAGIDGIFKSALEGAATTSDPSTVTGVGTGIGVALLVGGLLATGVAAAGGFTAALASLLVFLPMILLAVLTALVILIARQAILILLIILAPLAFAAFILPNTEKFFDTWRKTFITMLIFYPLVAILFSGSALAASILRLTATGGGFDDQLIKVFSLGVQTFPLFGMPFLLKFSGTALGRIAGMVNNPNKGPFDGMRKKAEGYRDFKRDQATIRNREGQGNAFTRNTFGRSSRRRARKDAIREEMKRESASATTTYIGEASADTSAAGEKFRRQMAGGSYRGNNLEAAMRQVQAAGVARVNKELEERVAAASELQKKFSAGEIQIIANTGQNSAGQRVSVEEHIAAARRAIKEGNYSERQTLYESIGTGTDENVRQSISDGYYAAGDQAVLGAAFGGRIQNGTSGGAAGVNQAILDQIRDQKITADALVRDAASTQKIYDVANAAITAGTYSTTSTEIESLRRVATESLSNAQTKLKAESGVFRSKIKDIESL